MKSISVLGIFLALAPLAGCASIPLANLLPGRPPQASAPPAKEAAAVNPAAPPADLEGAILTAQVQRRAGDLSGAAKVLSQLVLVAPDDVRVLGEYGKTMTAQGRSDDALAFLERATQLQPGDWTLYSAQGVAFDQKGNYRAAQASYARALQLKPGEPTVLNNDALSHMQAGDLDGAEKLLREATPGTPEFPRIAQNLALVQSLRAAQPAKAPAAAAAQPPVLAPVASADVPAPAPAPVLAPGPAVVATPVGKAELVSPSAPEADFVAVAVAPEPPPEMEADETAPSAMSALNSDPTVVMAPIPKAAPTEQPRPLQARLEVESPKPTPKTLPAVPPPAPAAARANTNFYLQAGAYASEARAGQAASTLDRMGARVMSATSDGRPIYRVRIGPFLNFQQANGALAQARALGHADLKIVTQ